MSYVHLETVQKRDPQVKKEPLHKDCKYQLKDFHGGGTSRSLMFYNNKIVVPKHLQKHVIDWYHITLCQSGINRTEATITQHLFWNKMRYQITNFLQTCPNDQRKNVPKKQAQGQKIWTPTTKGSRSDPLG
jgi:Integrase zinc binding domain